MLVTEYTWDPVTDSILEETDGAENVLASYTNEPATYGPLISQCSGGETRYFHFDALGSTRELTDDAENVTDTFTYDAWGSEVQHGGTGETPFRWGGRFGGLTECPNNVVFRHRTYCNHLCVWLTCDPLARNSNDFYAYVRNSPASYSDPSGLVVLEMTPPIVGHPWRAINDANAERAFTPLIPKNSADQIRCKCQPCKKPCSVLETLECVMKFRTEIVINLKKVSFPKGSPNYNLVLKHMYGHEQQHAVNYRERFSELAIRVSRLEKEYTCVRNCDPKVVQPIINEWDVFRDREYFHLNPPWNGDLALAINLEIPPVGGVMPWNPSE